MLKCDKSLNTYAVVIYIYLPSDSNPRTKRFWFKIKTDQSINMCTWNNFKRTSILKENLQDNVCCFTKIVHKGHFLKSQRTYLNQTTCILKKRKLRILWLLWIMTISTNKRTKWCKYQGKHWFKILRTYIFLIGQTKIPHKHENFFEHKINVLKRLSTQYDITSSSLKIFWVERKQGKQYVTFHSE